LDLHLMRAIQRIEASWVEPLFRPVDTLTGHNGAIAMWAALLFLFVLLRWWLPAMTLLALPVGGLLNQAVSIMVGRGRPTADEVTRVIGETDAAAYPSGHVVGAVLLYGLLFVVADHIPYRLLRIGAKAACVVVILVVGLARVWYGAHWPSDVTAAYALGGLLLLGLIAAYRRIDAVTGPLPLIHAAALPHDETVPHAHALTSLVLFEGPTVEKIYAPGFLPRLLYWLAFQAEFPYIRNQAALHAAMHRRNLAGLLSEHWFGDRRVARVVAIEPVGKSFAVRSEFVVGHPPRDRPGATAWLHTLRDHFEEAGYPTWQIDPRQPRAVDNVLETADGRYMIVDLESGLVSPLASLRTWGRALRRGLVPIFDDVYFDLTRAYVAREEAAMRAAHGEEWTAALRATLAAAEAATTAWRQGEPRLWGHLVLNPQHGFGVRHWPAHIRAELAAGQDRACGWVDQAIARWEADGRITTSEATAMQADMASPEFQAVLPHLGAHLGISVFLRFPFGSLTRLGWTVTALASAAVRRLQGRIDAAAWQQARTIHAPHVVLLCVLPSVGAFAYLTSKPVRRNRLLLRATADAVLEKVPFQLYRRTHLQHLIARPAHATTWPHDAGYVEQREMRERLGGEARDGVR
jgi:undecaprenyl-diphosphatase